MTTPPAPAPASPSPADRFSAALCLVSTTPHLRLLGDEGVLPLPRPDEGPRTRTVEAAAGLPPSRYYYVGRAHPAFGDCAFAFRPSAEADHTGSASPFDTGGLYHGRMHPYHGMEADPRAVELIRSTTVPLPAWRAHFARYLDAFFPEPIKYFDGPPNPKGDWGPSDLPARYPANTDWRAWTWEVRFYEAHDVSRHIGAWATTPAAYQGLVNSLTMDDKGPLDASRNWRNKLPRPVAEDPVFCQRLDDWVRAEVSR